MNKAHLSNQIIPYRPHPKPIVLTLLLSAVLFTAMGFSRSSVEEDHHGERNESSAAIERFWNVYHGNEYDQIPQVQQELQNAVDHDPENSTLYAMLLLNIARGSLTRVSSQSNPIYYP